MMKTKAQDLLHSYATQLDQFFAVHQDANTALSDWLASHFSNTQMIELLEAILKDTSSLKQICQRSYQHGNGFLKVVLLDRGYKLRLHIWFAGQSCEENIHDHRWSFASHILTGTLRSEIWRDVSAADAHSLSTEEFQYHAANARHPAHKIKQADCLLQRESELAYHAGQSYVMPEQKLHRIINPGDQLVATIMCTAPTKQGTTRLIPMHHGIDPNIQPPKLNQLQLAQQLDQFLALYNQESI